MTTSVELYNSNVDKMRNSEETREASKVEKEILFIS